MSSGLVILEEDHVAFTTSLARLVDEANAQYAFLVDKAGQQIASGGDLTGVDATALASLTAGNVAATEGVAQLVGETEFTSMYHEGRNESLNFSVIADRIILLVVFDERSSLGLVRLRVSQITPTLENSLNTMLNRTQTRPGQANKSGGFDGITDEDIDALFG